MSNIGIEGKLKPLLQGGKVADAVDIETDDTHRFVSDVEKTAISNIPKKITDLSDTPSDMAFSGVRNVVANSLVQQLQFVIPKISDNEDVELSIPLTGEILRYNGTNWLNDEERDAIAYQAFANGLSENGYFSDAYINMCYVADNQDVDIDTPDYPKDRDLMIIYNNNSEAMRVVDVSPHPNHRINGSTNPYSVAHKTVVFFVYKATQGDWVKYNTIDISSSGSGNGLDITDGSHTIPDVKMLTLTGATLSGTADNAIMTVQGGGTQPPDHLIIDGGHADSTFVSNIDGGGANL